MIAFVLVGLAAVAAAVGVVTARSTVHSVLWLIVHLCSLAVLYMTLRASFLGLVQVLLYAGAVMVLFVFVLGLLSANRQIETVPRGQPPAQMGLALVAAVVVAVVLLVGAGAGVAAGVAAHGASGEVSAFGKALFGPYLLPFEGTALALLTAIIGSVALSSGHDEAMAAKLEGETVAIEVSHALAEQGAAGGERR